MLNEEILLLKHAHGDSGVAYCDWYQTLEGKQSYPDGSPLVKLSGDRGNKYQSAETMILRPKSMEGFVRGMFLADAAAERGHRIKNLVLPMIPGGRQDRLNPDGDYLFTLKSVAKMINDRNFDQVITVDPHSTVTNALIDRLRVYPLSEVFSTYWTGFTGVIAPDLGATKRASEIANKINRPVYRADKSRDVSTGKLAKATMLDALEQGGHYLVVDDICDGGGTFLGLGEVLREQGVYANLYVTHGIFSREDTMESLLELYKSVSTTDSTIFNHEGTLGVPVMDKIISWM